jgi:hypothetical protein
VVVPPKKKGNVNEHYHTQKIVQPLQSFGQSQETRRKRLLPCPQAFLPNELGRREPERREILTAFLYGLTNRIQGSYEQPTMVENLDHRRRKLFSIATLNA